MSKRAIITIKTLLHLLCLAPFAWLLHLFTSNALANYADPINFITHFTGDWTLNLLFACLAITPIRRLSPRAVSEKLAFLIRFRRMIGLYAFFYATLHLATYIFLFSGYDITTALAGLRAGHPGELVTQWKIIWPRMVDDALKRRFIQVGLFAWFLLLALAVTSPTFILRAMGGKNWQRLHRLIYVAAIAGIIHYWWLVKKGDYSPAFDTIVLTVLLLARIAYVLIKRSRKSAVTLKSV
jgi:methionine sulfoxide reductase heme-binding subunit